MAKFGTTSKNNLEGVIDKLVKVCRLTVKVFDISVVQGVRSRDLQDRYFLQKRTKVQWPNSKHNIVTEEDIKELAGESRFKDLELISESRAVDIVPYHKVYKKLTGHPSQIQYIAQKEFAKGRPMSEIHLVKADHMIREHYCLMAGHMMAFAESEGFSLRWGGDWDQDDDLFDNNFDDLPHFEEN